LTLSEPERQRGSIPSLALGLGRSGLESIFEVASEAMSFNCLLLFATLLPAQSTPETHHYDFRDNKPLPADLSLFGPDAEAVVKPTQEGLRIALPTAGRKSTGWGVALQYGLAGDFELTATYELLQLEQPTRGVGAGVALNALPTAFSTKFTKVGRFVHSDGLNLFKAELSDKNNPRINEFNGVPASTHGGQLRLMRIGSRMHYQVADAPGAGFHEFAAWEYGTEDLAMIRFIANNNGSPTAVDALLLDLKVVGNPIPQITLDPKEIVWPVLIVGLPIVYLVIAAIMRRRKTSSPRSLIDPPPRET
jgi:hypothetical protein